MKEFKTILESLQTQATSILKETMGYVQELNDEDVDESVVDDTVANDEENNNDYIKEFTNKDDKFKYQLLSRMQSDCEYYLGNGGGADKHLFMGDKVKQIKLMNALWDSFTEKPEWLSKEQIADYSTKMDLDVDEVSIFNKEINEEKEPTDKPELEEIKKDLYKMFIESNLGANKHAEETKIQKVLDKLASAWGVDVEKINSELELGQKIEKEHTQNQVVEKIIALQHIVEDPEYYTKSKPTDWAEKEVEAEDKVEESTGFFVDSKRIKGLF